MNKPRLERALNRNFLVIIICSAFLLVGNDSDTIPDSNAASIKCQQFPEKLKRCEVFTCSYHAQIPLNNQVMSITRTVHGAKDRKCRVSEVIKNQKEEIRQFGYPLKMTSFVVNHVRTAIIFYRL